MKTLNSKTIALLVSLLIISMSASLILVPTATAHSPSWQIATYAYVSVAPDPIGVGQTVHVFMWLDKLFGSSAMLSNDYRFRNYNLTIIAPDGTVKTTIYDYIADPTSSLYISYTPTQVGTYKFIFSFPGQDYNTYSHDSTSVYVNDTFLPSTASTTLTVQEEQITSPSGSNPLPTEYWTRPIYGENPSWWTISSNWLGTGSPDYGCISLTAATKTYPTDAVGPQTAHIMWTKTLQSGGIVGGDSFLTQGDSYFEGSAYNQRFTNPIIVDGKLYYTEPVSFANTPGGNAATGYGPTDCVDLSTGELIWSRTDVPALSFAYIYDVQDPNQHGVYPPILFATSGGYGAPTVWRAFDADTGNPMFNVTNIPSGLPASGVNGEYLIYTLQNYGTTSNPNWYLSQWNSSKMWDSQYSGPSTSPALIPPITNGADTRLYDWNISISALNSMGASASADFAYYNNVLIGYTGSLPSLSTNIIFPTSWTPYTYFAINLNPDKGAIGTLLWKNTLTQPSGNITVLSGPADPTANGGKGVFTEEYKETMQWIGYSMETGQKLWGPTESQSPLDYYSTTGTGYAQNAAIYGRLYTSGFAGILRCYDLTSGQLLWTYGNGGEGNSTNSYFYNAYGHYPTFINAVGNGVIYLITTEHTITTPIYKGSLTRAVNATDGSEIWTLSDYTGEFITTSYAIADGYATFFNGYDNQIYCVGRGPSVTTVDAPKTAIDYGKALVISGTVYDVSAGTTQNQQATDFYNGVPCASDTSMSDWMGYVYQQMPFPTNFTGVQVTLNIIDANGNYRNIGTTTTDSTGLFSLTWKPDIPGDYKVIATFQGTNGYWPSSSATTFTVSEQEPTTTPISTATTSAADLYFLPMSIAIILAIIVVGAITVLALRKRP